MPRKSAATKERSPFLPQSALPALFAAAANGRVRTNREAVQPAAEDQAKATFAAQSITVELRMRTLLYEAANVMLTCYKGQLKFKDWARRHRQAIDHAQGARRSGASPRHHHARHAAGRNGVHLGVGLPTTETGDRIQLRKERRPREGTDDGVDFVASGITGRLRFQPCRRFAAPARV
jgi:hypothetical protein